MRTLTVRSSPGSGDIRAYRYAMRHQVKPSSQGSLAVEGAGFLDQDEERGLESVFCVARVVDDALAHQQLGLAGIRRSRRQSLKALLLQASDGLPDGFVDPLERLALAVDPPGVAGIAAADDLVDEAAIGSEIIELGVPRSSSASAIARLRWPCELSIAPFSWAMPRLLPVGRMP